MVRLGNPAADTKIGPSTSQVGMESNTFNAYLPCTDRDVLNTCPECSPNPHESRSYGIEEHIPISRSCDLSLEPTIIFADVTLFVDPSYYT